VDRVIDEYKKLALEFEGDDGEKTLGQAEHSVMHYLAQALHYYL
jgi:hypothetical protein